jgi:hypothetical protein
MGDNAKAGVRLLTRAKLLAGINLKPERCDCVARACTSEKRHVGLPDKLEFGELMESFDVCA